MQKEKKQYPMEKGWIYASLELKNAHGLDKTAVKIIVTLGEADDYEFAEVEINGNEANAIFGRSQQIQAFQPILLVKKGIKRNLLKK